jgi:hypothetical protein
MSGGLRLTQAGLERLLADLGDRDRAILADLERVRVLTGAQLTRLRFTDLSPFTRERTRRRVLARLAAVGLAAALDRRVGGVRAGSSGLVYTLGAAGQRALPLLGSATRAEPPGRARRPWTPGRLFLAHCLDVSELYVQLREQEPNGTLTLAAFDTEPDTWHPTVYGGHLKPDAYVVVHNGQVEDSYWIEVDRATESLPTLRRKLLAYADFALSGQLGPGDVMPRVLVTVPHEKRLTAVQELITDLPEPATQLVHAVLHTEATKHISAALNG